MSYISKIIALFTLFVTASLVMAESYPNDQWNLNNYEGAYAVFNEGLIAIAYGGSDFWHIQLTRKNIKLQNHKTYEAKFTLRGIEKRRSVEVRIGRDGFPYETFAEFGEISAPVYGQSYVKTFVMQSPTINNARFEFNAGKSNENVLISDVSLTCLDCSDMENDNPVENVPQVANVSQDFLIAAEVVDLRGNSMALGDVYAKSFELGVNAKVYGKVDVYNECILRDRSYVSDLLRYRNKCTEQNQVAVSKSKAYLAEYSMSISPINPNSTNVSISHNNQQTILPGVYGNLQAHSNTTVKLSSGTYVFKEFKTEPDAKIILNLSEGAIHIKVSHNVRFGDRNKFEIIGGNPSEIIWEVGGNSVDFGTDGKYLGRFIAPQAHLRIPSRSHLVGGLYAQKLTLEPQSTISEEPKATEISHSEEYFAPFFDKNIYRFSSVLSPSIADLEMYVYAPGLGVKINGKTNTRISTLSYNQTIKIDLTRNQISGFPQEAFSSTYYFTFKKSPEYKIYWNPQSGCAQNCDGTTLENALSDYKTVINTFLNTGKQINLIGGVWNAWENSDNGVINWPVGFKVLGNDAKMLDMQSEDDLPKINLGNQAFIKVLGKSPRSMVGLRISNGFNAGSGGALSVSAQKLRLNNVILEHSKSDVDGGALYVEDTLIMENVRFSKNESKGRGGALLAENTISGLNVIFASNKSTLNGGALFTKANNISLGNAIFYGNSSSSKGGAWYNENAILKIWHATVYANNAHQGYGAAGGSATGEIGNSIFWNNTTPGCEGDGCGVEVVSGFDAKHNSFSQEYPGLNNLKGNPKLLNENNPDGGSNFLNYNAGINLANASPLLSAGLVNSSVPEEDILGGSRSELNLHLGAYAWIPPNEDVIYGRLNSAGDVEAAMPKVPLINEFPDNWFIAYMSKSKYARVIAAKVPKNRLTKSASSAVVKIKLLDKNGKAYSDVPSLKLKVYKNGEKDGQFVFQTMTLTKGKPILFSKNPQDVNEYESAFILCMQDEFDQFEMEVIE